MMTKIIKEQYEDYIIYFYKLLKKDCDIIIKEIASTFKIYEKNIMKNVEH